MKLFVFANYKEAEPLLQKVDLVGFEMLGFARLNHCEYKGHSFLVCVCGVGKVFASAGLSACLTFSKNVTQIFSMGVAGSLSPEKCPLFSIALSSSLVQHDADTTALGDPAGMISGIEKVYFVSDSKMIAGAEKLCSDLELGFSLVDFATGDQFISSKEKKDFIKKFFGASVVDMESGALAQIAYVYGLPFLSIRSISDAGDGGEYTKNFSQALRSLTTLALAIAEDDSF